MNFFTGRLTLVTGENYLESVEFGIRNGPRGRPPRGCRRCRVKCASSALPFQHFSKNGLDCGVVKPTRQDLSQVLDIAVIDGHRSPGRAGVAQILVEREAREIMLPRQLLGGHWRRRQSPLAIAGIRAALQSVLGVVNLCVDSNELQRETIDSALAV